MMDFNLFVIFVLFSQTLGQPTIRLCEYKDCTINFDTVLTLINGLKADLNEVKNEQIKDMQKQIDSLEKELSFLKGTNLFSSFPITERTAVPVITMKESVGPPITMDTPTIGPIKTTRTDGLPYTSITTWPVTRPHPTYCPPNECQIDNGGCGSGTCHNDFHSSYRCATECSQIALDIVLFPNSVGGGESLQRKFMKDFIDSFTVDDSFVRVGMLAYLYRLGPAFNLNSYNEKAKIFKAIDASRIINHQHPLEDIINIIETMFDTSNGGREDVQNVLIYIVDGYANLGEYAKIYNSNIKVFPLIIDYSNSPIIDFASFPKQKNKNYFMVESYNELPSVLPLLRESVCSDKPCFDQYNSSYCSLTNTSEQKKPCKAVGLCKSAKIDIVFVIMSQNRVFLKGIKSFIILLLDQMRVSKQFAQVGIVRSIDIVSSENIFFLNTNQDRDGVYSAIRNITSSSLESLVYWSATFKEVLNQFSALNGNRSDASDYVVALLDNYYKQYSDPIKSIEDSSMEFLKKGGRILSVSFYQYHSKARAISTPPRSHRKDYFYMSTQESLHHDILWKVLDEICGGGSKDLVCRETDHAGRQCFCNTGDCTMTQIYD